jgi:hypothetical protein
MPSPPIPSINIKRLKIKNPSSAFAKEGFKNYTTT